MPKRLKKTTQPKNINQLTHHLINITTTKKKTQKPTPEELSRVMASLGRRGGKVKWMNTDITSAKLLPSHYAYWHDRAVFHFLVDAESRERYVSAVRRSLKPGGHIVVATFGPAGPEKCSGLDVVRYSPDQLHAEFGGSFRKISSRTEQHVTPWGTEQQFIYCYCRMP